jgi:hypothetical protein
MMSRRWITIVAMVAVIGMIATLAAVLISSGPSDTSALPAGDAPATTGPTAAQLDALAAELSSGDDARVIAAIADLPPGSEAAALKSLGSLQSVTFDPGSLRFDAETGAAVVDARLTDTSGEVRREREVLVLREGRWLLYSSLVASTATSSPLQ